MSPSLTIEIKTQHSVYTQNNLIVTLCPLSMTEPCRLIHNVQRL